MNKKALVFGGGLVLLISVVLWSGRARAVFPDNPYDITDRAVYAALYQYAPTISIEAPTSFIKLTWRGNVVNSSPQFQLFDAPFCVVNLSLDDGRIDAASNQDYPNINYNCTNSDVNVLTYFDVCQPDSRFSWWSPDLNGEGVAPYDLGTSAAFNDICRRYSSHTFPGANWGIQTVPQRALRYNSSDDTTVAILRAAFATDPSGGGRYNGFKVDAIGAGANEGFLGNRLFDQRYPLAIQNLSQNNGGAENNRNFYASFAGPCDLSSPIDNALLKWEDADHALVPGANPLDEDVEWILRGYDRSNYPPGTTITNSSVADFTLTSQQAAASRSMTHPNFIGGNGDLRTHTFRLRPGFDYVWTWRNVENWNAMQMWVPDDGTNYRAQCVPDGQLRCDVVSSTRINLTFSWEAGINVTLRSAGVTLAGPYPSFYSNGDRTFSHTGLSPGSYTYNLRNGDGTILDSAICVISQPTGTLTCTVIDNATRLARLRFTYSNVASGQATLFRGTTSLPPSLPGTSTPAVDYRDTTGPGFGTFTYHLRNGTSSTSPILASADCTFTDTPTVTGSVLCRTVNTSTIEITFSFSDGPSGLVGLYRNGTRIRGPYPGTSLASTVITDTPLAPGVYTYALRNTSTNTQLTSNSWDQCTITVNPSATLNCPAVTETSITVRVQYQNMGSVSQLTLWRGTVAIRTFNPTPTAPNADVLHLDSGRSPDSPYTYYLRAGSSTSGTTYHSVSCRTLPDSGVTPTGSIRCELWTDPLTQIRLTYNFANAGNDVTIFKNGAALRDVGDVAGSDTYVDQSLSPGTRYEYILRNGSTPSSPELNRTECTTQSPPQFTIVPTVSLPSRAEPNESVTAQYRVCNTGSDAANDIDIGVAHSPTGLFSQAGAADVDINPGASNCWSRTETRSVPPSATPGQTWCITLTAQPRSSSNSGPVSNNACVEVYVRPYLRAYGGDVLAGGVFANNGPTGCTSTASSAQILSWVSSGGYGSAGHYAVRATAKVEQFGSAGGGADFISNRPANLSTLTFANTLPDPPGLGNFSTDGICIPDYYNLLTKVTTDDPSRNLYYDTRSSLAHVNNLDNAGSGQFYINPGGLLQLSTSGHMTGITTDTTIIVDGDVNINNNVAYVNSYTNINNMPSFIMVVRGNITIEHDVTRLDGLYIAVPNGATGGNIYTCAPLDYDECQTKLVVNGSLIAKNIIFNRILGSLSSAAATNSNWPCTPSGFGTGIHWRCAAETVMFSPELLLANPYFITGNSGGSSLRIKSFKDLPPLVN